MNKLRGVPKNHDWGSKHLIPEFLGEQPNGVPVAEIWFGAHPLGPAVLPTGSDLRTEIRSQPDRMLGPSARLLLGDQLPYLVKLIAPAKALSLQVHPGRTAAAEGFVQEEEAGFALGAAGRTFQDATHKPEMLFALTRFDALVGFCVRRQARDRLEGLDSALAGKLSRRLLLATGRGIKPVVSWILDPESGPTTEEIEEFAGDCERRLEQGNSPEPVIDETILQLQKDFPGDAGIAVAFLMNHVRLSAGEAVFIPTGTIHSYQSGLGLEVMANSDNVIRAGLTSKHVDKGLFLELALFDGFPPTRIAPEHPVPGINHFRSPVEDFELTVATPGSEGAPSPLRLPGSGPRIVVGLDGVVFVRTRTGTATIRKGEALFLSDEAGQTILEGAGTLAQCSVP